MFGMVLNWLSGGLLDKVLGFVSARQDAKLAAMTATEQRRFEANESTKAAAKEVRLATAGFWEMRLLAFAIAFPFVEHLLAVWMDTRWGIYSRDGIFERCWYQAGSQLCGVPAFPAPFDELEGAILLSFFGLVGVSTGFRVIAGAIATRR